MKPDTFDALPRMADGRPIVTLMTDPDMSGPGAFLSLVDRGANGRRIAVVKADQVTTTGAADGHTHQIPAGASSTTPGGADGHTHAVSKDGRTTETAGHTHAIPVAARKADPGDELENLEVRVDHGQETGQHASWFQTLFGGLLGRGPVTKADAISFDAAVVIPRVFDRMDEGTSALHRTVATILHDEGITDKRGAIEMALGQFQRFVAGAFDLPEVLTAKQAEACSAQTKATWDRRMAAKRASAIGGANAEALGAALPVLQTAVAALEALTAPTQASKADAAPETDMQLDIEVVKAAAEAAAATAMKVAKAADPEITPTKLHALGLHASEEVFKAAVAGPAQPGIPTMELATQLAESAGISGTAKDPMAQIMTAINRMTMLTSKMAAHLGMNPETGEPAVLAADGTNAGLLHVVQKQGEALTGLVAKVDGVRATPRPSVQGGEQPAAATPAATRELATKAEQTAFDGTALGTW